MVRKIVPGGMICPASGVGAARVGPFRASLAVLLFRYSIPTRCKMSTRSTSSGDPSRDTSPGATQDTPLPAAQDALNLLLSIGRELERRDPARAADCLRQAADLARDLRDVRGEGEAQLLWGAIESQSGHLTEAEPLLAKALACLRQGDDKIALATGFNKNALLRLRQGRTDTALTHLRESLSHTSEITSGTPAIAVRADSLDLLAMAYVLKGETDQALRYCQEALELRRKVGDAGAIAKTLNQFGNLRHRMGHYQEAVSCYRQALQTLRGSDDARATAATANNLASTLLRLGELTEAHAIFTECRERFEALGEEGRVADVLSNLGLLAYARGHMEDAQAHHLASLKIQQELGKPMNASHALTNLSLLSIARGRCAEALTHADASLALLHENNLHDTVASALVCKATALLELGQISASSDVAAEAQRAAEQTRSQDQLAEVRILWADIHRASGDLDAALQASTEALTLAEEIEDPELLATANRCQGAIRLSRGELEESKTVLVRASRLLRGWERSYERSRILYEEGLLLARAGSRDAAAERLRRVERDFGRLGNTRWQIRSGLQLARIVAETDAAQAEHCRRAAEARATQQDLQDFYEEILRATETLPAASLPTEDRARGLHSIAATLHEALTISPDTAEVFFDPFFAFVIETMNVARVRLSLRGARAALWWRRHGLPAGRFFTADARSDPSAPAIDLVSVNQDRGEERAGPLTAESLPLPGRLTGELHWERLGTQPLSDSEREDLATAIRILALTLDAQFERTARTALPEEEARPGDRFEYLVGSSKPMQALYRLIEQVAPTDASILISGESGTGKELIARSIHVRSTRCKGPFVAISCPSIPKDLIESELFGHERGAFTGAVATHRGRIELADGGTLFLDEVGDMPMATQAKILRFLQERDFQRIGGHELRHVDVRVLSATSRDLRDAMKRGHFREDLFYRLNVVPLRAPSLRERTDDIPHLIEHFLQQLGKKRPAGIQRISRGVLDRLLAHDWPGNVRELRNTVEYMTTVCEGDVIDMQQLPSGFGAAELTANASSEKIPAIQPGETLESRLMDLEATLVREALEAESWNQSAAARRLGVTESKIRNRMKQFGIRHPTPL